MHCATCGTPLPLGVNACPSCAQPVTVYAAPATIPNYLVQAILVTFCCCVPFGIVAIVYAAQVNGKLAAGDMAGAQESSRNAKMWSWIAFGCWLLVAILYMGLSGIGALRQFQNAH
jgi:Interferon-induced transmembrane protein